MSFSNYQPLPEQGLLSEEGRGPGRKADSQCLRLFIKTYLIGVE